MNTEAAFIDALRTIATSSAARGLSDDAAVLEIGGSRLVLTMDAIVEGVHFLPDDPPETIAWKLVAVNVSDLAAKGAAPRGCLLSYALAQDDAWDGAFLRGLSDASETFGIPLLGGDTVRQPAGSPRSFSLVALGEPAASVGVPCRAGATVGDGVWVTGPIGDAGLGLALLRGDRTAAEQASRTLTAAYRTPRPDPGLGLALAPHVSAMMDISDGLLIDAGRLAQASDVGIVIELDRVPLSESFVLVAGDDLAAILFAATAGDDYRLLFTAPAEQEPDLHTACAAGAAIHRVGEVTSGEGLSLRFAKEAVPLPLNLGYSH